MNTFDVIWKNFKRNKRSIYSLYIFLTLFILSLFSELISNNKPIMMSVEGSMYYPYIIEYTERDFGGELETTPDYKGYFISDLLDNSNNWAIFPLNPHSYNSINFNNSTPNPAPPSVHNILGTDDRGRDVLARLIYGFRLSVIFALALTAIGIIIGLFFGAIQGYFAGRTDLYLQRFIEIWGSMPELYISVSYTHLTLPTRLMV